MDTTFLFYRWEHTPKCRLALKILNKSNKDLNSSQKRMWKVQDSDEENKVLLQKINLEFSQNLEKNSESWRNFKEEHKSCQLVPRWSSPPKNSE